MPSILVSSCLLGLKTRYDGTDNYCQNVVDFIENNHFTPIPICPEQLAGLPTPRLKCWFSKGDGAAVLTGDGKLVNENNENVTDVFLSGAQECLKIAQITHCESAILQQRSPSCGSKKIYLHGKLTKGVGITTAVLIKSDVKVYGNDNLPDQKN